MFLLLFSLQFVLVLFTTLFVWQLHVPLQMPLLVFISSLLFFSTIVFLVVAHYVAQPVRDIEEFASSIVGSIVNGGLPHPPKLLKNNLVGPEMAEVMQGIYEVTNQSQKEKFTLSSEGVSLQGLLKDLPAGCIIFNEKAELSIINPIARKLLGVVSETTNVQEIMECIKAMRTNNSPLDFIDWLHQSRNNKLQAQHQWTNVTLKTTGEAGEDLVSSFDLIASFHKRDVKSYELVLLFIDRSEEYGRQEKQMEFISLAAHELRGPLTVMRGLIDIFKEEVQPGLNDEHKVLMTRLTVSAKQLAGYIDNILNVSRVDNDSFEIHQQSADWQQVLEAITPELSERARAHNKRLSTSIPKGLPAVAVDPSAILHVINNLVENAIKYSKEDGEIIISAKLKDGAIETTVQDFGIGIPGSVVDNLFTKFYRSHRSKRIVSGTGLGLYLCKAIVEAHGGTIWVRSSEGVGTTFGFILPTYESIADQLKNNPGIIRGSHGWIKNHAMYRK